MPPEDLDLTRLESEILDYLLIDGANGPVGISDELESPPESISRSLKNLREEGLVVDKGGGVWRLSAVGITVARMLRRRDRD